MDVTGNAPADLTVTMPVSAVFCACAPAALVRLGYTDPDLDAALEDKQIVVRVPRGHDPDIIKKKLMHALYREKILSEATAQRSRLLDLLAVR